MNRRALCAIALLLAEGAPLDDSNRTWLHRRCTANDWLPGDEVRIREMLPATLRPLLETRENPDD